LVLSSFLLLGAMVIGIFKSKPPHRLVWLKHRGSVLFLASVLCVTGYPLLYTYDGVVQNWYTANIQVPMFIMGLGIVWYLREYYSVRDKLMLVFLSGIVVPIVLLNLFSVYPVDAHSPWPHQQAMLVAGRYLNQNHL